MNNVDSSLLPELVLVHIDRKQGTRSAKIYSVYDILSVYLEGGNEYQINQTRYSAKPPFSLLIPAGTYDNDLQSGNIYGICLMFNSHGLLGKNLSSEDEMIDVNLPGQSCTVPMIKEIHKEVANELADVLLQIKKETLPENPVNQLNVIGQIFRALSSYANAPTRNQEMRVHREAEYLHQLIEQNALSSRSLQNLYRELNISTSHAQSVFLKAFGMTPVMFRTRLRMNRARELLTSTSMNVGEVAYETGFNDPLYFSKVFKKTFGVTPSSMITKFNTTG